jgi:hypothetical protein
MHTDLNVTNRLQVVQDMGSINQRPKAFLIQSITPAALFMSWPSRPPSPLVKTEHYHAPYVCTATMEAFV